MGTKYSTVSITSYNASPPADDGTQDASNQLNWSKHTSKIGDPLRNAIQDINSNLVTALNQDVVAKTDSYNIVAADHDKTIVVTTTSAGANISLPDATGAGSGFIVTVVNAPDSTNALTIDLVTAADLMNGTTDGTISLPAECALTFITNVGTNGYNIKQAHGIAITDTSGTIISSSNVSAGVTRTLSMINEDATVVGLTNAQTLTNKTLTGATINTSTINGGAITSDTAQDSTAGTSIDFLSIPSWVKKITVMFVGVSTNGTASWLVQLGDEDGIEATGYNCGCATIDNATPSSGFSTEGVLIRTSVASDLIHGAVNFYLQDSTTFTWVVSGVLSQSDSSELHYLAGSKSLDKAVDRVRITTTTGADDFDAGSINIIYEG